MNLQIESFIQNSFLGMGSILVGLPFKYTFKIKIIQHEWRFLIYLLYIKLYDEM